MKILSLYVMFFALFFSVPSNATGNKKNIIHKATSVVESEEPPMLSTEEIAKERATRYATIAKDYVANSMKDPLSTQFRNVIGYYNERNGSIVICGEFNAKNGYGAYVGFQWFMSSNGGKEVSIDGVDSGTYEFSKKICGTAIGVPIKL